jgi:glycerol-3-phosphate dehydrogenase
VLVPWQGYTIIGTQHLPVVRECSQAAVSESMIADFIAEINAALPAAALGREDVVAVQAGLLPVENNGDGHEIRLVPDSLVIDHQDEDGLEGLFSVVGVKYSLARETAERVVNQVARKLGKSELSCQTGATLLPGGSSKTGVAAWRDLPDAHRRDLDEATFRRLIQIYGPETTQLLRYLDENTSWGAPLHDMLAITGLEVIHAVRAEMALHLKDVVLRRHGLILPVKLPADALMSIVDLMSAELGWTERQKQMEIETLLSTAFQTIGEKGESY